MDVYTLGNFSTGVLLLTRFRPYPHSVKEKNVVDVETKQDDKGDIFDDSNMGTNPKMWKCPRNRIRRVSENNQHDASSSCHMSMFKSTHIKEMTKSYVFLDDECGRCESDSQISNAMGAVHRNLHYTTRHEQQIQSKQLSTVIELNEICSLDMCQTFKNPKGLATIPYTGRLDISKVIITTQDKAPNDSRMLDEATYIKEALDEKPTCRRAPREIVMDQMSCGNFHSHVQVDAIYTDLSKACAGFAMLQRSLTTSPCFSDRGSKYFQCAAPRKVYDIMIDVAGLCSCAKPRCSSVMSKPIKERKDTMEK
ncbi:hypothetical protein BU24DRAFT_410278 [Aaosphaeria arxii CBS 175.79]|uniref:Uncharacterized protein n=1 Tax=Aaosphaeria arxii CBS 175.79 TaxID=1450172 RepID=A0A6A5XP52_9PLEO|nr:uncharacterized protein BU24DRAFT_410278 [Aaosphaeria arxii CBS 175.79]KAF2014541.1 hypothetical protein BU24DRAFT_410278 [Aaosphaeria arxii CBS 175.79]